MLATKILPGCLLSFALLTASGCMLSPLHGDRYHSRLSRISVFGVTPDPEEIVVLRAKDPNTGEWGPGIVWMLSGSASYAGYGSDWFLFSGGGQIPEEYWRRSSEPGATWEVEVQCVTPYRDGFLSFNQSLDDYWDPHEIEHDVNDLMKHAYHGRSIKIYASR